MTEVLTSATQREHTSAAPLSPAPRAIPDAQLTLADATARLTAPGSRFETESVSIGGTMSRVWKNAPATLGDIYRFAMTYPDREFLVFEGERATYADFGVATSRLASYLRSLGVRQGDRVAIILPNLPEWPVSYFAAVLIGAIAVPLNPGATRDELLHALGHSGAKVAIVIDARFPDIAGKIGDGPLGWAVIARGADYVDHPFSEPLEAVIGAPNKWGAETAAALPDIRLEPDDEAVIFYSSGTTGKPKGVLCTHRNLASYVMQSLFIQARMILMAGRALPDPDLRKSPTRANLVVTPLFHVTAASSNMLPTIMRAGKLTFMRYWSAERALQLIERERITVIGPAPVMVWQLLEHRPGRSYDLSSLEQIIYGGAPASSDLPGRIALAWPGVQPGVSWGMTETSAGFTGVVGDESLRRPSSCGLAPPVAELQLRCADGVTLSPPGEVGELWVKGPQVMKGYWADPEATRQALIDGWLRTGDVAAIDDEGYCDIVDRVKDMIIRGGENIYATEVEAALCEHPQVREAAVVGLAHRTFGEEPGAVVCVEPGAVVSEIDLRAFVGARLASFKVPVRVVMSSEPLPRNAMGKVLKRELVGRIAAAH